MLNSIPDHIVDKLQRAAVKYGMIRGPFTQAAIGSPFSCRGKGPKLATGLMSHKMANDDHTIELIADRILLNFEDTSLPFIRGRLSGLRPVTSGPVSAYRFRHRGRRSLCRSQTGICT